MKARKQFLVCRRTLIYMLGINKEINLKMRGVLLIGLTVIIGIAYSIPMGSDADKKPVEDSRPKCLGEDFPKTLEKAGDFIAEKCVERETQEAKENIKDRKRGKYCTEVCKLQGLGILDDKGVPSKAKYNDSLIIMLPTSAIKRVFDKPDLCFDGKYGNLTLAATDNECKNYQPFVKCVWSSIMSVCVENFDDKGEWD